MMKNSGMISIYDIIKKEEEQEQYNFFIPYYQRGYRWNERQVEDLLNDILEFKNLQSSFYCLQPLVVLPEKINGKYRYRVIDGQQRLTTIFLILKYLEDLARSEHSINDFFSIEYETRKDSWNFLNNIKQKTKEESKVNIDFYHMYINYHYIDDWFKRKIREREITRLKFLEVLLGFESIKIKNKNKKREIKFIWYELPESEDEVNAFIRLNIGKIPLTNAELIKAILILKLEEKDRLRLISEWDNIEYRLQDEEFWEFLNYERVFKKTTRIEFIFDLIASDKEKEIKIENLRKDDDRRSYYIFNELIKNENDINKIVKKIWEIWDQVKNYFRIFEEWFNDNEYYHLIGYLINIGTDVHELIKEYKKVNKKEFTEYLKNKIKKKISLNNKDIEELSYEDSRDKKSIEKILFLYNVVLSKKSGYFKYPFKLHKEKKWSIEHIIPQTPKDLSEKDKKDLLNYYKKDFSEFKEKIEEAINNIEKFDEIIKEIYENYGYKDNEDIHSISNLALLSLEDNIKLKNGLFLQKRKNIIKLDKDGHFIPLGTKYVFFKYFIEEPKKLLDLQKWNKNDRNAYLQNLKDTLSEYLGNKNE